MSDQEKKVPCEVFSRVVGYIRPLEDWNPAKQQEFRERLTFDASVNENKPNVKREVLSG